MGANQWPIADFGLRWWTFANGLPRLDIDLGANVQLGHFAPAPVLVKPPWFYGSFTISGVTRDSSGVALGSCQVDLFQADAFRTPIATTTSDGSGNFSLTVSQNSGAFFLRAYKSGSPDVAGTSVNTLTAV
jgi:hypothetical protein